MSWASACAWVQWRLGGPFSNRTLFKDAEPRTWEHDFGEIHKRPSMAAKSFPEIIVRGARRVRAEPTGVVGIALRTVSWKSPP